MEQVQRSVTLFQVVIDADQALETISERIESLSADLEKLKASWLSDIILLSL